MWAASHSPAHPLAYHSEVWDVRDSAAFVTPDAATGKRLLSRHLENASIFAALYEQVTSTLTLIRTLTLTPTLTLTLTPTLTPTPTLTLYAQRARRLVPPAVAGAAPTVAPCTPSKRFHFCMACRCACTESACACTRMRMHVHVQSLGSTLPGVPSLEVHACMCFSARSGSSLERACDVASVEDVSEKPGPGQTLAKAGAATQPVEGASHAGGAQEAAHKATRQRCALR